MGAILAPFRGWLIGGAVALAALLVGYLAWQVHDLSGEVEAERGRAEAAIRRQGELQASVNQLVDLNRDNIDALAALKAARAQADAAVVSANRQASAERAKADQIKRDMRHVPVPDQPFCQRAPRLCAAVGGLRDADVVTTPAGRDPPAGRAAGNPG